jgi:hypothetical protein
VRSPTQPTEALAHPSPLFKKKGPLPLSRQDNTHGIGLFAPYRIAIISWAAQSETQNRPSRQRGDSPNMRPDINIFASGIEDLDDFSFSLGRFGPIDNLIGWLPGFSRVDFLEGPCLSPRQPGCGGCIPTAALWQKKGRSAVFCAAKWP